MVQRIPLSDLVAHITDELKKAHDRSKEQGQAVMQFEECEIEFAVEAEKSAEGGIKIWVVNLGGGAKKTDSNTVKIKYTKIPGEVIQAVQHPKDEEEEGPSI